jgi:hypothetical protein
MDTDISIYTLIRALLSIRHTIMYGEIFLLPWKKDRIKSSDYKFNFIRLKGARVCLLHGPELARLLLRASGPRKLRQLLGIAPNISRKLTFALRIISD